MYRIRKSALCERLGSENVTEFVDDLRFGNRHYRQQHCAWEHCKRSARSYREFLSIRKAAHPLLGPTAGAKEIQQVT
jgi:hypothetical protein